MRHVKVIMLTGAMRPSPLQSAIGRPVASLPLGDGCALFDAWLKALKSVGHPIDLIVATNLDQEIPALRELAREAAARAPWVRSIEVVRDPRDWRGSAGVVRDLLNPRLEDDDTIMVVEAGCLPPASLKQALETRTGSTWVVVGATSGLAPAGVFACGMEALREAPDVGYCDLKEQLIPRLIRRGVDVRAAIVAEELIRLRDLDSYLRAVSAWSRQGRVDDRREDRPWRELGACVVEDGAEIDIGVILKDTVVLRGARVGAAAVLNGCLVTGAAVVEPGERAADRILTAPSLSNGRRSRRERPTPVSSQELAA
ncbi:MAG: hypothetical protein HRU76_14775 [Phycisphaeraceae bacterium]|nr:hypothetical protein [Phycisphaerales bacterium]QOJ18770.1 MAG: hypothetical protein HRU76_14775 [Phycisphaeraceae bacterium]